LGQVYDYDLGLEHTQVRLKLSKPRPLTEFRDISARVEEGRRLLAQLSSTIVFEACMSVHEYTPSYPHHPPGD